jgi:molecular chaperone GrpE (heat shock protein)
VSAVEQKVHAPRQRTEHAPPSRLDDIHAEIAEAVAVESEKERAARIARLKNEADTLTVQKVGRQHAAAEHVAQASDAYIQTRNNYVTALSAFLDHIDALTAARAAMETSISLARLEGLAPRRVEDLATAAVRSDAYPLRQLIDRAQRAGIARAVSY